MQWIDRRIEPGRAFEVDGPCRARTAHNVVLLDPRGDTGGRYAVVHHQKAPVGLEWIDVELQWKSFDWVLWCPDGHGFRLQIGSEGEKADSRAVITGLIEAVEGEFSVRLD